MLVKPGKGAGDDDYDDDDDDAFSTVDALLDLIR